MFWYSFVSSRFSGNARAKCCDFGLIVIQLCVRGVKHNDATTPLIRVLGRSSTFRTGNPWEARRDDGISFFFLRPFIAKQTRKTERQSILAQNSLKILELNKFSFFSFVEIQNQGGYSGGVSLNPVLATPERLKTLMWLVERVVDWYFIGWTFGTRFVHFESELNSRWINK